mmetsp:Transcript_20047/g.36214  ORF Transcript_20047/g.36214 Transcript_20047/m.36214 type:complete len:203 (-) Transcript_20047:325-933(-)
MAIRFAGSSSFEAMSRLLITLLIETTTFDAMADQKPTHVKETSVSDAIPTPAATTNKLIMTRNEGISHSMTITIAAVNNGSDAFRVCANATSTSAKEMFADRSPSQCSKANGIILTSRDAVMRLGRGCTCSNQAQMQNAEQVPKFTVVITIGQGCAVSSLLLSTLYAMFVPYSAATYKAPSPGEGKVGEIMSMCGAARKRCF